MNARQRHEWEQIDQGVAYCIRCPATTDPNCSETCVSPSEQPVKEAEKPKPPKNDTVRREIDRLARQMGRMVVELQKLKESV